MGAMVDIIHVYDRLKENYSDLEISLDDGEISVLVTGHIITANVSSAVLSKNGETVFEYSPTSTDELYIQIEQLINLAREGGAAVFVSEKNKKSLNPTYKAMKKRQKRFEIVISVLSLLILLYMFCAPERDNDWAMIFGALFVLCAGTLLGQRMIFKSKWVCPKCGQALPLKKAGLGRALVYTAVCPHCGENLETGREAEATWDKFGAANALYGKLQWKEEDELPMHRHMDAVRRGAIILAVFAALCDIASISIVYFVNTDAIPREIIIVLLLFVPLIAATALFAYYFMFAPLFIACSKPREATGEWRKKHIRFPIVTLYITVLWAGMNSAVAADKQGIANPVWYYGMWGVAALALCIAIVCRTPKRLRGVGRSTMLLCAAAILFSMALTVDLNYFLVKEEKEYQAEVVDTVGIIRDNDRIDYYVTVLLENGKTVKIKTDEELCREATQTGIVTLRQTESYLGAVSARIVDESS